MMRGVHKMAPRQWLAVCLGLALVTTALAEPPPTPDKVAATIKARFPGAFIEEVEMEDEEGALVYVAHMEVDGADVEARMAADGVLIWVSRDTPAADLPKEVAQAIAAAAPGARIRESRRHDLHAIRRLNRYLALEKPHVLFSAELARGKERAEIEVAADGKVLDQPRWRPRREYGKPLALPDPAAQALARKLPKARVLKARPAFELDGEETTLFYRVHLMTEDGRVEFAAVTPDGLVVQTSRTLDVLSVAKPVADAIHKAADGAAVTGVLRVERGALAAYGQFLRLAKPFVAIQASFRKGEETLSVHVSEEGEILQSARSQPPPEDDGEDDED